MTPYKSPYKSPCKFCGFLVDNTHICSVRGPSLKEWRPRRFTKCVHCKKFLPEKETCGCTLIGELR
jgi:hypothetical protein